MSSQEVAESSRQPTPAELRYVQVVTSVLQKGIALSTSDLEKIATRVDFLPQIATLPHIAVPMHLLRPLEGSIVVENEAIFMEDTDKQSVQRSYDKLKAAEILTQVLPERISPFEARLIGENVIVGSLRLFLEDYRTWVKRYYRDGEEKPESIRNIARTIIQYKAQTEPLMAVERKLARKDAMRKFLHLVQLETQGIDIPFTSEHTIEGPLREIASWVKNGCPAEWGTPGDHVTQNPVPSVARRSNPGTSPEQYDIQESSYGLTAVREILEGKRSRIARVREDTYTKLAKLVTANIDSPQALSQFPQDKQDNLRRSLQLLDEVYGKGGKQEDVAQHLQVTQSYLAVMLSNALKELMLLAEPPTRRSIFDTTK